MASFVALPFHLDATSRITVAGICGLVLTVGVARFAYTPLLPAMLTQAGLTDAGGGWLATINYAGYMAGALLASTVQRPGVRLWLYRTGLIVAVVTTAGMALTQNVAIWAILRFAAGLSSAGGMLLGSGLVLDWLVQHGRRPDLGRHFAGMGLGIVATGIPISLTAGYLDWASQWLAMAAMGAGLLVPAWAWMPVSAGRVRTQASPVAPGARPARRWLALLAGAYFCAGFGYVVSATFLVVLVDRQAGADGLGRAAWIVAGLAAVPASAVWDGIAVRLGTIRALLLAFAAQIVSILLPTIGTGVGTVTAAAALFGSTFIGIVSLTLALVGRRYPGNAAAAMGRLTLSYGVAQTIAPALVTRFAAAGGGYETALDSAAGVMVIGSAFLVLLARSEADVSDRD